MSAEDISHRIVAPYERALTSDVGDIEHVESQSLNGVAVVKVFFHPGADITRALAEASSSAQSLLRVLPPGTLPPLVLTYNASTVPIMELALSSKTLPEQTLYDLGNNFIRTQLATVQGRSGAHPLWRQGARDRGRYQPAGIAGSWADANRCGQCGECAKPGIARRYGQDRHVRIQREHERRRQIGGRTEQPADQDRTPAGP